MHSTPAVRHFGCLGFARIRRACRPGRVMADVRKKYMTSATLQFEGSREEGWRGRIPNDIQTFHGRSITIWIESAADGSCPDPEMVVLLDHILRDLPSVIRACHEL